MKADLDIKLDPIKGPKKVMIIYHKEDNDGVISGAMVSEWLSTYNYRRSVDTTPVIIAYNPSDYVSLERNWNNGNVKKWFDEFDYVIMTDISFDSMEAMKFIHENYYDKLIWIDHHKPVIEASKKEGFDDFKGIRDSSHSALYHAWLYFIDESEEKMPEVLKVLSAWDS